MNRPIKFRGKSVNSGEWFFGSLVSLPDSQTVHIIPCGTCKGDDVICNFVEVDPSTIGQFTGLKADDDKELYEGDIVEICRFDHNGKDHHYRAYVDFYMGEFVLCVTHRTYYQWKNNELHKTVSKYKENEAAPCWSLSEMYIGCCYPDGTIGSCEDITIVGNIHDNPDLNK